MKYGSRKFILSIGQLGLMAGLPVLYHHLGISDDLCKIVIAGVFGSHVYNIVNLLEGRIDGTSNKQS